MNLPDAVGLREARVLTALSRTEVPLSGRSVARIVGMTQSTVQRTLTRLREAGLVLAEPAPPSVLYRVNREHLAVPLLTALFRLDEELRIRAADHVGTWQVAPVSVVMYGSVVRGEAGAESDLDVLVVRPDGVPPDEPMWQEQVTELGDRLGRWTGRHASVVELSRLEAVRGLADEPYLREADREGWLVVGDPLHAIGGRA